MRSLLAFFFHSLTLFGCQSVIARAALLGLAEKTNYVPVFINFSAQTSSSRTQEMIETKMEKKRKNILGTLKLQAYLSWAIITSVFLSLTKSSPLNIVLLKANNIVLVNLVNVYFVNTLATGYE